MRLREVASGDPGLPLYLVDNGTVALAFLPAVGGRLLSLSFEGAELLWRNPVYFDAELRAVMPRAQWPVVDGTFASWANVGGSKTWPAPQGWAGQEQWAGPPDAVLDSGVWSIDLAESAAALVVTMVSPDDERTGLRVTREFSVPHTGAAFAERIVFTNVSDRVVTWSIWEVCQVPIHPGDAIEIDSSSHAVVDLGTYDSVLATQWDGRIIRVPAQDAVAKRGFPAATGRIARVGAGPGIELTFSPLDARYPDQDSRAEVWMQYPTRKAITELSGLHPDAHLAEIEVLSPLAPIAPGASTSMTIGWRAG